MPTGDRPLICVYCGVATSSEEDEEHVLPESLGSKETLYRGAVCKKCNNRLGNNVDSKVFNEPLAAAGQVAQDTEGKRGTRTAIGKHVRKKGDGISVVGGESGKPHEFVMSRAIAKCGVNIFTFHFGSDRVRAEFPELINYVLQPKTKEDIWPYACVYTPVGGFGNTFGIEPMIVDGSLTPMITFACASGVFVAFPDRGVGNASEFGHEFIKELLAAREAKTGQKLMSMTYATRENR